MIIDLILLAPDWFAIPTESHCTWRELKRQKNVGRFNLVSSQVESLTANMAALNFLYTYMGKGNLHNVRRHFL